MTLLTDEVEIEAPKRCTGKISHLICAGTLVRRTDTHLCCPKCGSPLIDASNVVGEKKVRSRKGLTVTEKLKRCTGKTSHLICPGTELRRKGNNLLCPKCGFPLIDEEIAQESPAEPAAVRSS